MPPKSLDLSFLAGRPVAVLGLGKSGLPAARALRAGGVEVWAWDDAGAKRAEASREGVPLVDLATADLARAGVLLLSPGIPHRHPAPHPAAARALAAGCPIVSDVELLLQACPQARVVGITGTNGKSTTTTLIGHLLAASGRRIEVGGNLGPAALSLAPLAADGVYVLELSSYQLELTPGLRPAIAILLNITDDHLARHGGIDGYIDAKKRIFARQTPEDTAVVGIDDAHGRRIAALLRQAGRRVVPISGEALPEGGVGVDSGWLIADRDGRRIRIACLGALPTLPGAHNAQNAAAAAAGALAFGLEPKAIAAGLASYPGLAHRQERVECVDGVLYVNDSKATNADAAAKALVCYDGVFWIAGGLPKEGGIASLEPHFARIRHAFLIGQAAPDFARVLDRRVPATNCGTLDRAVVAAAQHAAREPGAVVLLSPACASWDQFENFEARGAAFRAAVKALPGRHEAPARQGAPCP